MKSLRVLIALTLAPFLLVACSSGSDNSSSSGSSTDPADLVGTWVLDEGAVGSLSADVPPDARVTIVFTDGKASGTAGCNSFATSYEATDAGALTFGPLASTMMACEEPLMSLETAYFGTLGDVSAFSIDGTLTLTAGDVTLSYARESD